MQRHFLRTTGLTYKTFTQIERAQKAMALLQMGRPAADVAFALGYSDQPHLIRSLKAIMGETPGRSSQAAPTPNSETVGFLPILPDWRLWVRSAVLNANP